MAAHAGVYTMASVPKLGKEIFQVAASHESPLVHARAHSLSNTPRASRKRTHARARHAVTGALTL